MRIALVHYHLIRGGVSSVIRHQARSLLEAGDEVLVITGETDGTVADFGGAPVAVVPDLRYDSHRGEAADDTATPERLASDLLLAMEKRWGSAADIFHVHNPLIRKNRLLLPALRALKDRGVNLLLQSRDFAEEFRPDLYERDNAYIEDVHYAVVNGRDYSFLRRAGLSADGVHLLPPAVANIAPIDGLPRTRYLYPVRASRRKNIGEALLFSLFIPKGRTVALSLPPASSRDFLSYGHWKSFAARFEMPVEFDVGEKTSLSELLGTSYCSITTSMKEGFGFSFLEPWTAGRAVIGRRINHVCQDFERSGLRFGALYDSVAIPMVYLPSPLVRHKLEAALSLTYRSFKLEPPPYALKMLTSDLFSRDTFDFGRLDEDLQTEVLETLAANAAARDDIAEVNPFFASLADWKPDEEEIAANRERVLSSYACESALARLRETYRAVIDHPVHHRISKSVLLELFLDPLKLSIVGLGRD